MDTKNAAFTAPAPTEIIQHDNLRHVMVDIKTLGLRTKAAILSINAVQFDPYTGETGNEFSTVIDVQSSLDHHLGLNAGSLKAQLQNPSALTASLENGISLPFALSDFSEWLRTITKASSFKLNLWAKNPEFDTLATLKESFFAAGFEITWNNKKELDVRTIEWLAPGIRNKHEAQQQSSTGNPIDECKFQIAYIADIMQRVSLCLNNNNE